MKVAIVHYHLGHGGVSEVIAATSRLLTGAGIPHLILAGSSPDAESRGLPACVVEGLGYAESGNADGLLEKLRSAAHARLGGPPDVWHFHNHSLGKNPAVPQVVARLAAENARLLLHLHDLAEDGRPENAARLTNRASLYPAGPRIHYAFLNSRDRGRFIKAGLPETNAHLLFNPVEARAASPAPSGPPLLLYPVRGIRRKNLGEFLLLAALAPPGTRAAVTRAPLNPESIGFHDAWRRFSGEMKLPAEFDVVDHIAPEENAGTSFDSWLSHATHFVTTSVAEGFGMVFPESIARGKPLLGRNLPHLARDHAAHGNLYDRLLVPADWIDADLRWKLQHEAMNAAWTAWGRRPPAAPPCGASLDFGNLPEVLQQRMIRKSMEPGMKILPQVEISGEMLPATDWLAECLAHREPAAPDRFSPYALPHYQTRLNGIYQKLMDAAPAQTGALDPEEILSSYLTPEAFHFLTSPAAARRPPPDFTDFRAIIFDVYGTLLAAPSGGVKPDPEADPLLREILTRHGHRPPDSPSAALHAAVLRHHAAADTRHPEVDLRKLWREVLALPADADTTALVLETERAWHPARLMPGVERTLQYLSEKRIPLGLLSNAQCNTLPSLGPCASFFETDLNILSYRHGIAKPSPELFHLLVTRLAARGIPPCETLYIGNDPLHDIEPAAARGFRTALFTDAADSHRAGFCFPDYEIRGWLAE